MMSRPKIFVTGCFFLFFSQAVFSYSRLDILVPPALKEKLLRDEVLSTAHFDETKFDLLPKDNTLISAVEKTKQEIKPSVIVESLCLYKKPPVSASLWSSKEKTALFNGIVSISTLAGLRYYSPSRKQSRLFYETSTVIDSPEKQNPLPDPVFTEQNLPGELRLYVKQKDLTFGENIYRFDFNLKNDIILFYQSNLTTMYYGIIPILGKEKLRSIIAVIDSGEHILIYMVSMANALSFPGMKNRVGASFSARSEAVLDWFKQKADIVY